MEFLGFTQFTIKEKQQAEIFISNANILALEEKIVEQTIQIKQYKKIKLPDAIIADNIKLKKHIELAIKKTVRVLTMFIRCLNSLSGIN